MPTAKSPSTSRQKKSPRQIFWTSRRFPSTSGARLGRIGATPKVPRQGQLATLAQGKGEACPKSDLQPLVRHEKRNDDVGNKVSKKMSGYVDPKIAFKKVYACEHRTAQQRDDDARPALPIMKDREKKEGNCRRQQSPTS